MVDDNVGDNDSDEVVRFFGRREDSSDGLKRIRNSFPQ